MQVLAFGEHVGGDEYAQFVGLLDLLTLVVGLRREAPGQGCGVGTLACSLGHLPDAARCKLRVQVAGGVGKLGEDEQFVFWVLLLNEIGQSGELGVGLR